MTFSQAVKVTRAITCPILAIAFMALPAFGQSQLPNRKFDFGDGPVAESYQQVLPTHIYSDHTGFGFEPGGDITAIDRGGADALTRDFCTSERPFYFSVKLPEGNYRVKLTLGDPTGASNTTVKAELRRLMLGPLPTKKAEVVQQTIVVNVRMPKMAGDGEVKLKDRERQTEMWAWDEKLTLEFNGPRPCICGLEIEPARDLPTLYLLGDSTVCDQPSEPYASWGQMLPRFFTTDIAIANHAESGESLRSSRGAKRLDKVLNTIKSGDWLLIQFGHNDMKAVDEAAYKAELKRFVAEARNKDAQVVLVTPMHRRTFDGPKIINSHRGFPAAVREAATEEKTPLIDLHSMSQELYEAWGPDDSGRAFGKPTDGTHHSNYGAYELARCIIDSIRQQNLPLDRHIRPDVPPFNPSRPDAFDSIVIPPSPGPSATKPDGS